MKLAERDQRTVSSLTELAVLAAEFAEIASLHVPERRVILLRGLPGAGKTEFVKAFVHSLQSASSTAGSPVSSPTFALHHSYELESEAGALSPVGVTAGIIDHWDLYRLESEDELESSGFWDQFSAQNFTIFVEWPERLKIEWIPQNVVLWKIEIEVLSETSRQFRWSLRPLIK